ncbi:hypothetical protein AB6A40_005743 [Gnathostoma spinigerum]|uniref:Transmembrane protein 144 n=1 Tax=Gnathostoma spinigerum TaxID=75299 RepID=A0ABD6EGB9_9BILA
MDDDKNPVIGLVACGVASLAFGSYFAPVRKFNAGDGLYVQWVMSIAIIINSFFIWAYIGFTKFYPLAMLGGVLWCLGNATAVPIMQRLGMAMGMLIWNTTNCLTGWATGNFGWFGLHAKKASSPLLNYLGLLCVIVGGGLFSQVKGNTSDDEDDTKKKKKKDIELENPMEGLAVRSDISQRANGRSHNDIAYDHSPRCESPSQKEIEKLKDDGLEKPTEKSTTSKSATRDRVIGIALSLLAGVFYGSTFTPVQYMQDNWADAPKDGLSYVFSHSFGIFISATVLFIGYGIVK